VVQDGDTLYDLAGKHMNDVYQWPKLWSYNAHVTNPHWIYPGDIIYLKAAATAVAAPVEEREEIDTPSGMYLPVGGYIDKENLDYVGRILASPKESRLLAQGDTVFVGFGGDGYTKTEKEDLDEEDRVAFRDPGVKKGDVYAVVRASGDLTDEEDRILGRKYLVLGSVKVTDVVDNYMDTAIVDQSWLEMERGDLLIPYERQLVVVGPLASEQDMVASIVDTLHASSNLGESHYIYVDKGASEGVRVGNRFFIFQRREGISFAKEDLDPEVPWQRVGQVMVLDVKERYSTAVITNSVREITVGDRLEMYNGF